MRRRGGFFVAAGGRWGGFHAAFVAGKGGQVRVGCAGERRRAVAEGGERQRAEARAGGGTGAAAGEEHGGGDRDAAREAGREGGAVAQGEGSGLLSRARH